LARLTIPLEIDKDIKENLYAKLSEEHKLIMEERDTLKEELTQKRKEVWDLEYKVNQQTEDLTSIQNSLTPSSTRKGSVDASDRMQQR